jgi:L-ascorbate metabolism protein UlaG (beta-lactamase superfamily)
MERLTWLGHATVLVEVGGARLLTDPVLRGRVAHLRREPPLPEVPRDVDAVLISHLHHDHLDAPSLRALDPPPPLVVSRGAGRLRAVRGLGRGVRELGVGETLRLRDACVRAVPAVHDGHRLPLSRGVAPLGFVIEGRSRVYFAGDTELFAGMRSIGGDLDVALVPVAGWGPRLGPGHMDADQAARAVALLRPVIAVPIHWGTLAPAWMWRGRRQLLEGPGSAFARRVAHHAPDVEVRVLAPGQGLELHPGTHRSDDRTQNPCGC